MKKNTKNRNAKCSTSDNLIEKMTQTEAKFLDLGIQITEEVFNEIRETEDQPENLEKFIKNNVLQLMPFIPSFKENFYQHFTFYSYMLKERQFLNKCCGNSYSFIDFIIKDDENILSVRSKYFNEKNFNYTILIVLSNYILKSYFYIESEVNCFESFKKYIFAGDETGRIFIMSHLKFTIEKKLENFGKDKSQILKRPYSEYLHSQENLLRVTSIFAFDNLIYSMDVQPSITVWECTEIESESIVLKRLKFIKLFNFLPFKKAQLEAYYKNIFVFCQNEIFSLDIYNMEPSKLTDSILIYTSFTIIDSKTLLIGKENGSSQFFIVDRFLFNFPFVFENSIILIDFLTTKKVGEKINNKEKSYCHLLILDSELTFYFIQFENDSFQIKQISDLNEEIRKKYSGILNFEDKLHVVSSK